jgi:hypothetical protein
MLADELSAVVNRYMMHLEPSAEAQEYGIRLILTGKLLNIEFGKAPGRSPNISFTLQSDPDAEAPIIPSGLFGRGRS